MKLSGINKDVPLDWEAQNDRETAEIAISQLRADLAKTARERDDAEQRLATKQQLLDSQRRMTEDYQASRDVAVGALRETDAHVERLLHQEKLLRGELETAGREYNALFDENKQLREQVHFYSEEAKQAHEAYWNLSARMGEEIA